jgi:hypothetical protein
MVVWREGSLDLSMDDMAGLCMRVDLAAERAGAAASSRDKSGLLSEI